MKLLRGGVDAISVHMWRCAVKNVHYSRKINDSEAIPCPFTCALVVWNVRMIPVSPAIISRLRRKPEIKKWKNLGKRWWNVRRHHLKQRFHMVFTKMCSKYKGLCIDFRSRNAKSDVSACFTTICQEFLIFWSRVFSWVEIWWSGIHESCARYTQPTHT